MRQYAYYKDIDLYVNGMRAVQVAGVCFNCMESVDAKTFTRVGLTPERETAFRFLDGEDVEIERIKHLKWQEVR